jgi:hypothetical protein
LRLHPANRKGSREASAVTWRWGWGEGVDGGDLSRMAGRDGRKKKPRKRENIREKERERQWMEERKKEACSLIRAKTVIK